MDTSNTQAPAETQPSRRDSGKFGVGLMLLVLAGVFGIAALILIWFGIFPGLIAVAIGVPLAVIGARLLRTGKPATTLRD